MEYGLVVIDPTANKHLTGNNFIVLENMTIKLETIKINYLM